MNQTKTKMSSKELARRLTEEGVVSDERKVKKWRSAPKGRSIAPDAAAALDRIFGTVHVFARFAYDPHVRTATQRALDPAILEWQARKDAEFADLRRENKELRERIERLEEDTG